MVCLNKNKYKDELDYYKGILGSEAAAYYVLAMNNGYTLDKDHLGNPSTLYQDILSACGNNARAAILEKSLYYTQNYLKTNGDWTRTDKEPSFSGLMTTRSTNTVALNVLCNDAFREIHDSLASAGITNDEYAMRTAIERSRKAYLDLRDGEDHNEKRQSKIQKYKSRSFWKKVLGFFFSKYNKQLLTNPSSEDRQDVRKQAMDEFNATLDHLILEQITLELESNTDPFAVKVKKWIDQQRNDNNTEYIEMFMRFSDIARSNIPISFDDNKSYMYAAIISKSLGLLVYNDAIALFGSHNKFLNAYKNRSHLTTALETFLKDTFKDDFKSLFIDQIKNISTPQLEECILMWAQRDYSNTSMNQLIYDVMLGGYLSRLIGLLKQSRKSSSAQYLIKSKIQKLKRLNKNSSDDNYTMYLDFLDSALDELLLVNDTYENFKSTRTTPSAQSLTYTQTDVIGFYSNIINKYLDKLTTENSGLSLSQIDRISDIITHDVNPVLTKAMSNFNVTLELYCDDLIDDFVDENYALGDNEHHKSVLKDAIRNKIKNGNIGNFEQWIGDATQSQSQIVRLIANMLNNDDREVTRSTTHISHKLKGLFEKAESYLSKLGIDPFNAMKLYCELDEEGLPTGYFVRGYKLKSGNTVGINYGRFEKDRKNFEKELRLKYNLLADEHGNTIWNFDIHGEEDRYNKYMDELDDWLGKHCNRRFVPQYYKDRRRILSRDAREAIDEIQSLIKLLIEKCTDKSTGYVYTSKLSSLEQQRLKDLRVLKKQLSNLYTPVLDNNGEMIECKKKQGKQLEIAESIIAWNKHIQKNVKYKSDWAKYNDARSKLPASEQAKFDEDNSQYILSEDFYNQLASCNAGTQTEYYQKLSASKNKIASIYKDKEGYRLTSSGEYETYINILKMNDVALEAVRKLDEELARNKVKLPHNPGAPYFSDIAEMKPVMHPSAGMTMFDFLLEKANIDFNNGNLNAINEFYDKYTYINSKGEHEALSIFYYVVPKDKSKVILSTMNDYQDLDESSSYVNSNYSTFENDAYQPLESIYKNDVYEKIQGNQATKDLYEELLNVMDQSIGMIPDTANTSRYKMPQITADSSDIMSRNIAARNIKGAIGSVSQHFTITELDSDIYREDIATRPDGSLVNNVPIRFVSSLEDPTKISCNIVKTVTQFYMMAKNFELKSQTVPKCEALISQMRGGMIVGNQTDTEQVKRALLELEMYGYGKIQKGFGNENEKMTKSNKFWTKFVNNFRSIANVALLAGNVFSAAKGFISAYYQTGTEAFVGRYYDKGDRFFATGLILKEMAHAVRSVGTHNTTSKILAAMQYNGISTSIEESLEGSDKVRLRKLLGFFKMGLFTVGDYTVNSIVLTSVYHATRLVENIQTKLLEYMTEEECIDSFIKAGKSEKEAIKYFEDHSNNHMFNMYELALNGEFKVKDSVTVKINGVEHDINPSEIHNFKRTENRIAGTTERRGSIMTGVMSKHGKNKLYQNTLTKLLVTMRGYLFSQGWERFKGGDDFNLKYYDEGKTRDFNENNLYRGQYDLETGHCEYGIFRSLKQIFTSSFIHDVALAMPIINKVLNDQNRLLKKTDLQNILKFCLDVVGVFTFCMMCAWLFIPPVRKYPDEWWRQFMLLVSMGCAIETATPVNPSTALDLMQTVSTTYSYVKDLESLGSSIGDVFGWNGHSPTEYIASGPYKNKPRFFRGVMKSMLRPTGLSGYYESFTPAIPGLDKPNSKYLRRQRKALNKLSRGDFEFGDFMDVISTPLGAQSKYDWYNHNTWPATWLPSRKDKKKKKK